ncbi:MAG: ThuA domain-containing protein [Planctomycetota bacterium]
MTPRRAPTLLLLFGLMVPTFGLSASEAPPSPGAGLDDAWEAPAAFGDVSARAGWQSVGDWVFPADGGEPRIVPGTGVLLDPTGDGGELATLGSWSDLEVSGEFLLDRGAHAILRFLGRYSILLSIAEGGGEPGLDDPGAILGDLPAAGTPPRIALPCAAETWHRFSITVRAPRFDARGVKTANARVLRVLVDGHLLQVGVDLPGPSHGGSPEFEVAAAPFALGSRDGGVAFRGLRGRAAATPARVERSETAAAGDPALRSVALYTRTTGFRHGSIPAGIRAVKALGKAHGFEVRATEDPEELLGWLGESDVVCFLNTTGDVLDDAQQRRFEDRITAGLGFVGIHSAADTEYDWPFYGELVGAYFKTHPRIQEADLEVVDRRHPATAMLPGMWVRTDEWYDFRALPVAECRVLTTLRPESYEGSTMEGPHPIAWCRTFPAGNRSMYIGGGHTDASYAEPLFLAHIHGALRWAAGDDRLVLPPPSSPGAAETPGEVPTNDERSRDE